MGMRPYALPVVLLVLLAGCSGGSADTASDGSGAAEDERTSAAGDQKATAAPTSFEDVDWDGELGTHACATVTSEVCPVSALGSPTSPLEREALLFIADTAGPAQLSGNLTLSWESADYAITHTLRAYIATYTDCADRCTFQRLEQSLSGSSPLTIPLDAVQLQEGERLGLYLRPVHSQVANTQLTVAAGQPVHLEGRIGGAPA